MLKVCFLFLFSLNLYAIKVPTSWSSNSNQDFNPENKSHSSFSLHMDELMNELSDLAIVEETDKARASSFELTEVSTMLGVSASGSIGVLGVSGSALAEIHWSPKKTFKKKKKIDVHINKDTNAKELERKLHSLADHLEQSGKIKKGTKIRQELTQASKRFKQMVTHVRPLHKSWKLEAIQANFGISASGNVNYISFGTAVELTFEWSFNDDTSELSAYPNGPLESLVWAITEDLHESMNDTKYLRPVEWEVGLSIGADGEIGIASAGASVGTTLVFSPITAMNLDKVRPSLVKLENHIPLMITERNKSVDRLIKIGRKKFKKGLKKAIKIGDYLSQKAMKQNKKWKFSGMTTEFEIGLEGGIGVATVSGGAALKIEFENPHF
ncbi:MAG: hypothetical protein ACO20H_12305 [Bacteriovoracaceae bacterium]